MNSIQNNNFYNQQQINPFYNQNSTQFQSTPTPFNSSNDISSEVLRRFPFFDRNGDGFINQEELRALISNCYSDRPSQIAVNSLNQLLYNCNIQGFNISQTIDILNKIRAQECNTTTTTTTSSNTSTQMMPSALPANFFVPSTSNSTNSSNIQSNPVPMLAIMPAPSQIVSTPFGSVPSNSYQQTAPTTTNLYDPFSVQTTTTSVTSSLPTQQTAISQAIVASGGVPSRSLGKPPTPKNNTESGVEEQRAFVEYINSHPILSIDPDLARVLPMRTDNDDLYKAVQSGVLLCKFLNASRPDTVPESRINKQPKSVFEATENQSLAIAGAKKLGFSIVNIGPNDLIEGKVNLVLGMVWQIIRFDLLSKITVQMHPELCNLVSKGNSATGEAPLSLQQIGAIAPEQVLLHWLNHHLRNAGYNKQVNNFSSDLQDASAYSYLLNRLAPELVSTQALMESDPSRRANNVVNAATRLGCSRFVTPKDILSGNSKLNLAFVAELFNSRPGIALPSMEELERLRRENEAMASVLMEAEARLRQLAMDRQLAEELQNQEIVLARQREAETQRQIQESESFAYAQQLEEEERLEEERRKRREEAQASEEFLQREMMKQGGIGYQQHDTKPPTASYSQSTTVRIAKPTSTSNVTAASSYPPNSSYSSEPKSSSSSSSRTTSKPSKSSTPYRGSTSVSGGSGYYAPKKVGLFERAGHKIDRKLNQLKDVKRYN